MAEEKEKPLTREDVLRLIEENSGTAKGLDLSGETFVEGIDLSGLNLEGIILDGAVFPPKLELADLQANMQPDEGRLVKNLIGANLQKVDLSFASLNSTRLWEAQLQKSKFYYSKMQKAYLVQTKLQEANLSFAQLQGANFEAADFYRTDLHGAEFNTDTKFDLVHWADYRLGEEEQGLLSWAADTYRQLKMWHTNAGMYDIAGEFFYREMTVRRKALKWWPNPLPRAWSKFVSLICGYGERPPRVFLWAASVVLGLAFVYFIIGSIWEWSAFWSSLYFSAVSFTALGYGGWVQATNEWIKGIGAFESFIGVFTIALFLITFIRKMTR